MYKLASCIVRDGALAVDDAVGWTVRLAGTLEIIHRVGSAHGRISPKALQVLGSSHQAAGFVLDAPDLSDDMAYHSRERLEAGRASPEDDTWAVGVMLYESLTGALPFPGTNRQQVMARVVSGRTRRLSDFGIEHPALQQLLDELFVRDPRRRLRSVTSLRERLVAIQPATQELRPLKLGKPDIALFEEISDDDGEKLTEVLVDEPAILQARIEHAKRKAAAQHTQQAPVVVEPSPEPPTTVMTRRAPAAQTVALARLDDSDSDWEDSEPRLSTHPLSTRGTEFVRAADGAEEPPVASDRLSSSTGSGRFPQVLTAPGDGRSHWGRNLAVGALFLAAGGVAAYAVYGTGSWGLSSPSEPPDATTSAPLAGSTAAAAASSVGGASSATASTAATRDASAAASTPSGAHSASAAPPPSVTPASGGDLKACVLPLFPQDTFAYTKPTFGFLCTQSNPSKGGTRLRIEVIRSGGGRKGVTTGMREWAQLGWYEMAAFAVIQRRCCADSPPLQLPQPIKSCPLQGSLAKLAEVATAGDDEAVDAALGAYTKAVLCVVRAGGAHAYGQRGWPGRNAQRVFRRTIERARQAARR